MPRANSGIRGDGSDYDIGADEFTDGVQFPDTDGDGLPDYLEEELGLDPNDPDTDDDGLNDGDEVNTYLTDPLDPDSDDDGMADGWEVDSFLDPLADDSAEDPDGDGLTNLDEFGAGTDPGVADTDATRLLRHADRQQIVDHRAVKATTTGRPDAPILMSGDPACGRPAPGAHHQQPQTPSAQERTGCDADEEAQNEASARSSIPTRRCGRGDVGTQQC